MQPAPITTTERIITLDILRGFALLGIILANILSFKSPLLQTQSTVESIATSPEGADAVGAFLLEWLVIGKFYPLFSFLFGLGFFILYDRLQRRQAPAKKLYIRRLLFLFILGLLHLIFLWSGDILHTYAIAGFFLLLFVGRQPKNVLYWSIGFISLSAFFYFFFISLGNFVVFYLDDPNMTKATNELVQLAFSVYGTGTYGELLSFRLSHEIPIIASNVTFVLFPIIGLFLLGMFVGMKGYLHHSSKHLSFWKKLFIVSLFFGGGLSFVYACLTQGYSPLPAWIASGMAEGLNMIAGPLLMLSYVSSFVLFFHNRKTGRISKQLARVGRMALTNYIIQTIICFFLFYGVGFGWFGQVSIVESMGIAVLIFLVQMLVSSLYLRYFQQGPLEKIWRAWMYRTS